MHPVNVTVIVLPLYPLGLFQLVILKNVREIVMFYNRRRSVVGSPPTGSFFLVYRCSGPRRSFLLYLRDTEWFLNSISRNDFQTLMTVMGTDIDRSYT